MLDNEGRRSDPVPGTTIELGFLGTVIHAELPEAIETQQTMSTISPTRLNETDIQVWIEGSGCFAGFTYDKIDSSIYMPRGTSHTRPL